MATESHLGSVLDDVHDVRVPDSKHSTKRGLISLMTKHELTVIVSLADLHYTDQSQLVLTSY